MEKTQAQAEAADKRTAGESTSPEETGSDTNDSDLNLKRENVRLYEENEQLQRDMSARNQTIQNLRAELHQFEQELTQSRDQLVAEVEKLSALTSGELELKPSKELETMESDELLTYARDVAEDLDVRRQTLDEGLQGIDTIKDSFDENKKVYEQQQGQLQTQLQELRTELDSFDREQEEAKRREAQRVDVDDEELRHTIGSQRDQLEQLSTRIRQLIATNQKLTLANKKTYQDLESAVRKVIPLRKQIDELQSLQETLQRYIRTKYERTFTMRKLSAD